MDYIDPLTDVIRYTGTDNGVIPAATPAGTTASIGAHNNE